MLILPPPGRLAGSGSEPLMPHSVLGATQSHPGCPASRPVRHAPLLAALQPLRVGACCCLLAWAAASRPFTGSPAVSSPSQQEQLDLSLQRQGQAGQDSHVESTSTEGCCVLGARLGRRVALAMMAPYTAQMSARWPGATGSRGQGHIGPPGTPPPLLPGDVSCLGHGCGGCWTHCTAPATSTLCPWAVWLRAGGRAGPGRHLGCGTRQEGNSC